MRDAAASSLAPGSSAGGWQEGRAKLEWSSAFERLLYTVPAVLDALPESSLHKLSTASWSCLFSALQCARYRTPDLNPNGQLLEGLAQLIPRTKPQARTLNVKMGSRVRAVVPVEDVGALVAAARAQRKDGSAQGEGPGDENELRKLEGLVRAAEELGTPLRLQELFVSRIDTRESQFSFTDVCRMMATNTTVRRLTLSLVTMDESEAAVLADMLRQNATLRTLRFKSVADMLEDEDLERGGPFALEGVMGALGIGLAGNRSLEELEVDAQGLGPSVDLGPFSKGLAQNTTLRVLELHGCPEGFEGQRALAEAMRTCGVRRLRLGLDYELNYFSDHDQEWCSVLGQSLMHESRVVELDLGAKDPYCERGIITDIGELTSAIRVGALGETLQTLNLQDWYKLPAESVSALFQAVRSSTAMRSLNVSGVHAVGRGGVTSLADLLKANRLTRLEVNNCAIDDAGAAQLGAAMAQNNTLEYLDVGNNDLGPAGVVALVRGLGRRSALQHLIFAETRMHGPLAWWNGGDELDLLLEEEVNFMRRTFFDPRVAETLAGAIERGAPLVTVDPRGYSLSVEACKILVSAMERSTTGRKYTLRARHVVQAWDDAGITSLAEVMCHLNGPRAEQHECQTSFEIVGAETVRPSIRGASMIGVELTAQIVAAGPGRDTR